jgi:hypothetical protein
VNRIAGLLLMLGGTAVVADDGVLPGDVSMDVKPVLCIIDRRTPACDMSFLVAWQSAVEGYYCLFSHLVTDPIRCWREADAGQHEERRMVDESFQFWLTSNGSDEPLAAVTVEVMTTETGDRRRKRRSRHVWDIL